MKSFFAYALVIMGFPNCLSLFVAGPLVILFGRARFFQLIDIVAGLATIFAGIAVFRLFGLRPTVAVPIISSVWFAIYFIPKWQYLELICSIVGIFGGWICYAGFYAA